MDDVKVPGGLPCTKGSFRKIGRRFKVRGIEAIKGFKAKYGQPSKELLEKVKNDNKAVAAIKAALKEGAKTVPQIAKAAGIPEESAMWYMNALKKYNIAVIEGSDDGYKLYALKGGDNAEN